MANDIDPKKYGKKLSPQDFYNTYLPAIIEATKGSNVSPELAMAQLAVESGWGKKITPENGFSAVFGKKHGSKSGGNFVTLETTEDIPPGKIQAYIKKHQNEILTTTVKTDDNKSFPTGKQDANGQDLYYDLAPTNSGQNIKIKKNSNFSSYNDLNGAIKGYVNMLTTNPKFKDGFTENSKNKPFIQLNNIDDYATGENYTSTVSSIMSMGRTDGRYGYALSLTNNKPEAFVEKNDDGTYRYYTRGHKGNYKGPGEKELLANDDWGLGGPTFNNAYAENEFNEGGSAKYPGYFSHDILMPKGSNTMSVDIGGTNYLVNNDSGEVMEVTADPGKFYSNADDFKWTGFGTNPGVGLRNVSQHHGGVAETLMNEFKEYALVNNLDKGSNWTKENFDVYNKVKGIAQLNDDVDSKAYKDAEYRINKQFLVPFYKTKMQEGVDAQQNLMNEAKSNLANAINEGASDEDINNYKLQLEQYTKSYNSLNDKKNEYSKALNDAVAPEKRTPSTYGWFEDRVMALENWMSPGAVGIDYNTEQEGRKLIGTSTQEKKDLLTSFNNDFKEFFDANKKIEEAAEEEAANTEVVTDPTSTSTSVTTKVPTGGNVYNTYNTYNPAPFESTMDHINDLGTVVETNEEGDVIEKQKTLKQLQEEMANINDAISNAGETPQQVGEYAPDNNDAGNIGGFIGDAGRALIGMKGAMEEVPTYETGEMYNTARDEMTARRDLGLSAEEKNMYRNMAERGYGYDVKNIRRLAGGNAGVALGNLGRASGQLYDQYSNLSAMDQAVRRQNRQQFYSGAIADEQINRQKFQDDLSQTLMNKQAGAGLVNDALSNIDERAQFNRTYGKGSPYHEMMKSTWMSSEQERINKDEALKNTQNTYNKELEQQRIEKQAEIDQRLEGSVTNPVQVTKEEDNVTTENQPGNALVNSTVEETATTELNPYTTQQEGDSFRTWMNENHPEWTSEDGDKLDPNGGFDNKWINEARGEYEDEFLKSQETIVEETEDETESNIVESVSEDEVVDESVAPEDQTSEDRIDNAINSINNRIMANYKSEFEDDPETLARYEENPIAFVEDDIKSWEEQPDSEEKTQSLKNLNDNLEILKRQSGNSEDESVEVENVDEETVDVGSTVEETELEYNPGAGLLNEETEVTSTETTTETTEPSYSNSAVNDSGELVFNFNGKEVNKSDFVDDPMEEKNDGQDYIRNIHNEESAFGNASGGGVGNYGYTGTNIKGAALREYYDNAEGNKQEKAMATTNKYIIGLDDEEVQIEYDKGLKGGNTTILQDLDMSRADFDKLPDDVKSELVNWKLNTGRGSTDLVLIASGGDWDGTRAFTESSPTADKIKDIDLSKLTKKDLNAARQKLYKGRIEGLRKKATERGYGTLVNPNSTQTWGEVLKFAEDGYNNSQKYR